jgi:hypothetical protein
MEKLLFDLCNGDGGNAWKAEVLIFLINIDASAIQINVERHMMQMCC